MYGYQEQEERKSIPYHFGLNAGKGKMTKFEFITNGGKDGAEQEALDIQFDIDGGTMNYRIFPFTGAYDKKNGNVLVTDPESEVFKKGNELYNSNITHILHAFVEPDILKAAINQPIASFKQFVEIVSKLLPTDFHSKPLDMFLQYQWAIADGRNQTYLQLPKDANQGKWVVPAQDPAPGTQWKEVINDKGLHYVVADANGETILNPEGKPKYHPISRTPWFTDSNWAKHQKECDNCDDTPAAPNAGVAQGNAPSTGGW